MLKIKDKFNKKVFGVIFVISFVFSGVLVFAPNIFASDDPTSSDFQLVPDCGGTSTYTDEGGSGLSATSSLDECGWAELLELLNRVMKFMIYISVSIGVLACAYAGFLYVTAFGQMGKIEQAHKIFSSAIAGMVIILLAWLIIATILKVLQVDPEYTILDAENVETLGTQE